MMKQILIVDDDEQTCKVLSSVLEVAGYQTDCALDGQEALQKLDEVRFDLVISDIFMPHLNGIELLKKIKESMLTENVIMMTGRGNHELRQESLRRGAIQFLEKPIQPKVLIELVNRCLHQGFNGQVSEISLFDLTQVLAFGKKTVVLEVQEGAKVGQIYFENGELIHAETSNHVGEQALYECLSWDSGSFREHEFKGPIQRSIEKPTQQLLLEAVKRVDEMNARGKAKQVSSSNKEDIKSRLKPLVDKILAVDGILATAWLDLKGHYLLGGGVDLDLLKTIPQFVIFTETQFKPLPPFGSMVHVTVKASDGRLLVTIRFKSFVLAVLAEAHIEEMALRNTLLKQFRKRKAGGT